MDGKLYYNHFVRFYIHCTVHHSIRTIPSPLTPHTHLRSGEMPVCALPADARPVSLRHYHFIEKFKDWWRHKFINSTANHPCCCCFLMMTVMMMMLAALVSVTTIIGLKYTGDLKLSHTANNSHWDLWLNANWWWFRPHHHSLLTNWPFIHRRWIDWWDVVVGERRDKWNGNDNQLGWLDERQLIKKAFDINYCFYGVCGVWSDGGGVWTEMRIVKSHWYC